MYGYACAPSLDASWYRFVRPSPCPCLPRGSRAPRPTNDSAENPRRLHSCCPSLLDLVDLAPKNRERLPEPPPPGPPDAGEAGEAEEAIPEPAAEPGAEAELRDQEVSKSLLVARTRRVFSWGGFWAGSYSRLQRSWSWTWVYAVLDVTEIGIGLRASKS